MTQYEILNAAQSILRLMADNGIKAEDVRYLDMYGEWCRLKGEGHKVEYIAYYLSERYECNRATVYRAVKRMARQI